MDLVSFELGLSDGRSLTWRSPARMVRHRWLSTTGRRGAVPVPALRRRGGGAGRHVSYSRPGYFGSSRQPGRAVADCAADTAAILAHLNADRCYTVGTSGGGPHAPACAALLADRVPACATVAGVGPFGAQGLDRGWAAKTMRFWAALTGPGSSRHTLSVKPVVGRDHRGAGGRGVRGSRLGSRCGRAHR